MGPPSSSSTGSGSLESWSPHTDDGHLHCVYAIRGREGEGFQLDIMGSEDSSLFNHELALDDDRIPLIHEGKQTGLTMKTPYGMDSLPREPSCSFEADNPDALQTEFGAEVDESGMILWNMESFFRAIIKRTCHGPIPTLQHGLAERVPMLLLSLSSRCKSVGPTDVSLAPPGADNSPNRIPPKAASPF